MRTRILYVRDRRRAKDSAMLRGEIFLEFLVSENIQGLLPALMSLILVIKAHKAPP